MKKIKIISRGFAPPILVICKGLKYRLYLIMYILFINVLVSIGQNGVPECPSIIGINTSIQIPVIVHVMYDDNFQNVDYPTVVDMINTINDQLATVEIDGEIVDISLFLVENGTCTPGFERLKIEDAAISASSEESSITEDLRIKENSIWDESKYLNIWILRRILWAGDAKPGYSTMPFDQQYIDGIVIAHDKLNWLVNLFGKYANLFKPWNKQDNNCQHHFQCTNGDYCDDIIELRSNWFELVNEQGSLFDCSKWITGFGSENEYFTYNGQNYLNPWCYPLYNSLNDEYFWQFPADNYMADQPNCWNKFSNDQYRRMVICFNGARSTYSNGSAEIIDLSENTDHTISELLSKAGLNSLQELCESEKKFNILLGGNLIINSGNGNPVCFKNGTKIRMLESARITVNNSTTLNLNNVHIFACEEFWDRIFVQAGSTVNISNNCIVEKAYNAISAEKGAKVNVENSVFNNNFVSIYLSSAGIGVKTNVNIKGCVFKSDDSFFFSEDGSNYYRPLAAIKVYGQQHVNLRADQGSRNTFTRLRNGILAFESSIYVYYSDFKDISKEGLGYGSYLLLDRDGYAVKVYNGNSVSVVRYNTVDNTTYAIGGYKGLISARDNIITNTNHAIVGYRLTSAKIQDNNIFSDMKGIFLNESNMQYGLNNINANYVTVGTNGLGGGNANAIGINMELTPKADIFNNFITIAANKAGLQLQNADATIFEDNDVWVNYEHNGKESAGISVLNSENVTINNNYIENTLSTDNNNLGIFAAGSYKGFYECNHTNEFNYGMHYFTTCDDSYLYGNQFLSNNKDLVLGSGYATNVINDYTVIGDQGDWTPSVRKGFGNKWVAGQGVAHHSGTDNIIKRSRFLVQDTELHPQGYLPKTIEAASKWFYNDALSNMSPCTGEPGSDLPPLCINLIRKIQSVDTLRSIDPCKKMMWQYKYYKELIKMKKKGFLTDECKLYLISQQNNVVLKIAEAGFMVDSIARLNTITSYNLNQLFSSTMLLDSMYSAGLYGTPRWESVWADYQRIYSIYQASMDLEIIMDREMSDSTRNVLNNISIVDSCLTVLVKVYKIRLNLLNGDTLRTAEKDWLRPITLACPDQIGEGVYIARSLLSMYETENEYPELHQCFDPVIQLRESENTASSGDKLIVYPNPASEELNIVINRTGTETGTISVSDINGKFVYNNGIGIYDNFLKIKTEKWKSGVYFVQYIGSDGKKRTEKVFINR